jgi:hypothetical protein
MTCWRPRSWLLTQASDAQHEATAVVEIAERLVVITGAERVAIPASAAAAYAILGTTSPLHTTDTTHQSNATLKGSS